MQFLKKLKNKLYYYLVESNEAVRKEYQGQIDKNPSAHKKHRLKSWFRLIKLNLKYRLFPNKSKKAGPCAAPAQGPAVTAPPAPARKPAAPKAPPAPKPKPAPASLKNPLVYLGAESTIEKKAKPEHLIKELLEFEVVSFDIFDTLLFRPMARPTDLFMLLGKKYGVLHFEQIRIRAEQEARAIHRERFGDTEVDLEEIYSRVEYYTGIDAQDGMLSEIALEKELLFPNPYMKRVFDMLRANGKRFIAVSDMYLPKSVMTEILAANGFIGFEEIFVSCDCRVGKSEGKIYDYVEKKLSFSSIVHIDDNWQAVVAARKNGWSARHYKNVNNVGLCHRTPNLSPLIGSAFAGIVNQHLYNGLRQYSPLYEFGFTYGGFFALGYCAWIEEYCRSNQVDKVLFLSRDGYLLKNIAERLFPSLPAEYFYFSRIAGSRISIRSYFYLFLDSFVLKKAKSGQMPICYYMDLMDITALSRHLSQYGLSPSDILSEKNRTVYNSFLDFLTDYRDEIATLYQPEIEAAKLYIQNAIQGCRRVAVVDIGWRGSSALALKHFVQKECQSDCEVIGLMAASPYDVNAPQILDGSMQAYLFSLNHNYNALERHERFRADNAIYEFFLTACHSTLKRYRLNADGSAGFEFEEPDVENYPYIEEIHKGMLDFVAEYFEKWKSFPCMFRIPGNDAAVNIQNLAVHKEYFRKYFQDFQFNMGVGGNTVPFPEILKNC